VLVFYRGLLVTILCPAVSRNQKSSEEGWNVRLLAISIDPPDVSRSFADKIASDGKGAVNFPLLSDPEHKIIDA